MVSFAHVRLNLLISKSVFKIGQEVRRMEELSKSGSEVAKCELIKEIRKTNVPETRDEKLECYRQCVQDPWEIKSEKVCHEACQF